MNLRRALTSLICVLTGALAVSACDDARDPVDSGIDSGPVVMIDGSMIDSGTTDAGTDAGTTDAGTTDSGPVDDAGPDANLPDGAVTADGCVRTLCATGECGMRDDGCGGAIDCGICAIGDPCDDDADCGTGTCFSEADSAWDGGYCTDQCRVDTDCGTGSHCGFLDAITRLGFCVADCAGAADCRGPAYECFDDDMAGRTECAPVASGTGGIGTPCTAHSDCAGARDGLCVRENLGWHEGYCSEDCQVDGDCPSGAHCGLFGGGSDGICLLNCTSDTMCRADGYICYNGDEDTGGSNECFAAGTGAGLPGAACNGIWDCAGGPDGRCLGETGDALGGYCYQVDCAVDADCPSASHCSVFGTGATAVNICTPDCTTSAGCRASGYACWDANDDGRTECWSAGTGTVPVGDPCTGVWECAGGARALCIRRPQNDFAGGYCALTGCTLGGTGAASCPTGSHCSIFAPDTEGLCVDNCAGDVECRTEGYRCYDTGDDDTATECWVAATGLGAVGGPCRWRTDCAGDERGFCILYQTAPAPDFIGGYCSRLCNTTACPTGSECLNVGILACIDQCSTVPPIDRCRTPEYTCQPDGASGNICFPAP